MHQRPHLVDTRCNTPLPHFVDNKCITPPSETRFAPLHHASPQMHHSPKKCNTRDAKCNTLLQKCITALLKCFNCIQKESQPQNRGFSFENPRFSVSYVKLLWLSIFLFELSCREHKWNELRFQCRPAWRGWPHVCSCQRHGCRCPG